jgi:hypothetical protein
MRVNARFGIWAAATWFVLGCSSQPPPKSQESALLGDAMPSFESWPSRFRHHSTRAPPIPMSSTGWWRACSPRSRLVAEPKPRSRLPSGVGPVSSGIA